MWTQAKIKFRQLLFDDSGIAMAYTIVTFLVFFMICISTFAMSENIRRKMELQNACDAAAYSAAVVQADMLSRIAVLNRALSWTYLQTNRRQMDYVIGVWLDAIVQQHMTDESNTENLHRGISCHYKGLWYGHYASYSINNTNDRQEVHFNNGRNFIDSEISVPGNNAALSDQIAQGNINMTAMELAINRCMMQMEANVCSAALIGFAQRSETAVPRIWLGNRCYYSDNLPPSSIPAYFVQNNSEIDFLAYTAANPASMGPGYNSWWRRGSGNIQRHYVTGGLRAQYDCMSFWYIHPKYTCVLNATKPYYNGTRVIEPCSINPINSFATISSIPGDSALLSSYNVTGSYRLAQSFFGRDGTILVSATAPMNNPFSIITGIDTARGIYSAFGSLSARNMWAVSAARAGVRLREDNAGYYRVQWPGEVASATQQNYNSVGIWNLCEDDWDGVLLPVTRAWDNTRYDQWGADAEANPDTAAVNTFSNLMRNVQNQLPNIQTFTDTELENMYRNNIMRH